MNSLSIHYVVMLHIMKTKKNFVLDAIFCTVEGNTVSKHKAVIWSLL